MADRFQRTSARQKVTDHLLESAEMGGRGVPLDGVREAHSRRKESGRVFGVDMQIVLRAAISAGWLDQREHRARQILFLAALASSRRPP